jgi:hypothetical protein
MIIRASLLIVCFLGLLMQAVVVEAAKRPAGKRVQVVPRRVYENQANRLAEQIKADEQSNAAAAARRAAELSRANHAATVLSDAKAKLADAQAAAATCVEERKELEKQIEKNAGPDHPFILAQLEYEQATRKLKIFRNQFLASIDWQAELAAAKQAGKSASDIAAMQTSRLNAHDEYRMAAIAQAGSRRRLNQARQKLYSENALWRDNIAAARRIQADIAAAKQMMTGQARRQITATGSARDANRAAAAAQGAISQKKSTLDNVKQTYREAGGKKQLGASP